MARRMGIQYKCECGRCFSYALRACPKCAVPRKATALEATVELLTGRDEATTREITDHLVGLGFSAPSCNNHLRRMVFIGTLQKVRYGVYTLKVEP